MDGNIRLLVAEFLAGADHSEIMRRLSNLQVFCNDAATVLLHVRTCIQPQPTDAAEEELEQWSAAKEVALDALFAIVRPFGGQLSNSAAGEGAGAQVLH